MINVIEPKNRTVGRFRRSVNRSPEVGYQKNKHKLDWKLTTKVSGPQPLIRLTWN